MKLSARDRQRLQWVLAVIVGGGAVLYAVFQLVIQPLKQARIDGLRRLQEYSDRIDKATLDLRGMQAARDEHARLVAALDVATNRFVLRPVLGSMLVSVQNVVEPIAASCGLQIEEKSFQERGQNELPVNKKDAGMTIERYQMEVSMIGSFAGVRDFISTIEKTNEYVCVTDVEILGRPEDVTRHKVRVCMEWPVFGAPKPAEAPAAPARRAGGRTEE